MPALVAGMTRRVGKAKRAHRLTQTWARARAAPFAHPTSDGRDHRRAKRRRSSNGYGERSDAVLRTAMRRHDGLPVELMSPTRATVHMHKILRGFLVAIAMLAAPVRAQSPADAGREVYVEHCAQCHGERLMATGSAPDLKLLGADQRARFDGIVRDGKGQMPAWAGMITDEQIDQVWAYIRSRAQN